MSFARGVLCIVFLATSAGAQAARVDSSLPSYLPVSGVVGDIRGHSSGVIRGQSSVGTSVLMKMWGKGFRRIYPKVRVGLDDASYVDVADGAATFGPRLGKMGVHTRAKFKKRYGFAPTRIPVCRYVLAVYVHKDNPLADGLRMKDVETIFSVNFWDVKWGDLGCKGEWLKMPIRLYARDHLSTQIMFARHCDGRHFLFKRSMKRTRGDAAVVSSVANDAHGIGLASIGCRTDNVRALAIAPGESSKFVRATAENASNGSYPLTDHCYLFLNHDPQAGVKLDATRREFLRYILSREGQQAVIKAGYTPLTAKTAKRALAGVGLVPSGQDSPWDRMITGLRAREVPDDAMDRIERLARKIGGEATYEQLVSFTKVLATEGLTSTVTVEPDGQGATIRYRRVGDRDAQTKTAKHDRAKIRIGLYHIWTERDGKATSPKNVCFQIVREHERIKIQENR